MAGLWWPTPAAALREVDCNTPADFCTGDPCVTTDEIKVTVPVCTLTFAGRTLVLKHVVFLPSGGALSLTARTIEVRRRIDGTHFKSGAGDGADITLIAGDRITVRARLDAAGRTSTGNIRLTAGGSVELRDQLRARAHGDTATASGGTVTIQAGGSVISTKEGKMNLRGRYNHTSGGQVVISGATGVNIEGKINVRGSQGGAVTVTATAGSVRMAGTTRADGAPSAGGNVTINASGSLTLEKGINTSGGEPTAGSITLTAGGVMRLAALRADGHLNASAGMITALGQSVIADRIRARGGADGGVVNLSTSAGDLTVEQIDVRGRDGMGGSVTVVSAGDLTNEQGTNVSGGDFAAGEAHFSAAGDITLGLSTAIRFEAGGFPGGVIEADAAGDLTVEGKFKTTVGGCIGLMAGGVLDTTGAEFDQPVMPTCP